MHHKALVIGLQRAQEVLREGRKRHSQMAKGQLEVSAGRSLGGEHDHETCVADAVAAAEARVNEARVRLTHIRRRVLELVCASHRPIGAYELINQLGAERPGATAPPTVYRALDFLMAQGLIHRINSLNAYVACFGPHKPHEACLLICEKCRSVVEFDAHSVRQAVARKAADTGFDVRTQIVEVTGVCRRCQGQA